MREFFCAFDFVSVHLKSKLFVIAAAAVVALVFFCIRLRFVLLISL